MEVQSSNGTGMDFLHFRMPIAIWRLRRQILPCACGGHSGKSASESPIVWVDDWPSHAKQEPAFLLLRQSLTPHYQSCVLSDRPCIPCRPQPSPHEPSDVSSSDGKFWCQAICRRGTDHWSTQCGQFECRRLLHIAILDPWTCASTTFCSHSLQMAMALGFGNRYHQRWLCKSFLDLDKTCSPIWSKEGKEE